MERPRGTDSDSLRLHASQAALLWQAVEEAASGRSSAMVVRGEAGVGKTTLLEATAARATPEMQVLRCAGVEAEAELSYAALAEALYPLVGLIDGLTDLYAAALRGALGMGSFQPISRLTLGVAALALLAEASMSCPLALIIDDAQWIDRASAEALLFAGRRLRAESISMIIAVRDGVPSVWDQADFATVTVPALTLPECAGLLRQLTGERIDEPTVDRLWQETGGNPLALVEIVRNGVPLRALHLGPQPIGARLGHIYEREILALPDPVRLAVAVAAASHTNDSQVVYSALRQLDLSEQLLDTAEAMHVLVSAPGRLRFRHPLLRSTAYYTAEAADRRRAHRGLAQALVPFGGAEHRAARAWHLASAAQGLDAEAATALIGVADAALQRGSMWEASRAYERAAAFAPDSRRGPLLAAAARTRLLAGDSVAADHLLDQAAASGDHSLAGEIAEVRAQLTLVRDPPRQVHDQLLATAHELLDIDQPKAAGLLIAAVGAACMGGEVSQAETTAELAQTAAASSGGPLAVAAAVLHALARMLAGHSTLARQALNSCWPTMETIDPLTVGTEVFAFSTMSLMWLEDYDRARYLLARGLNYARRAGALERLPSLLSVSAELQLRTGRWNEAYLSAGEAATIGREAKTSLPTAYALSTMARIDAARGNSQDCRTHTAEIAQELANLGAALVEPYADVALALDELGAGHPAEAARLLRRVDTVRTATGLREPTVLQYHPDLVQSLLESGDPESAQRTVRELGDLAAASPSTWSRAALMLSTAFVTKDASAHTAYEQAIDLFRQIPDPFAQAKAQLMCGCWLRRAKRRRAAQEQLGAALSTFETLGATPWQERARRELQASGANVARQPAHAVDLTSQETQIALAVVEGRTNRDVASAFFLSVKTVEYHLGHIYSKLGVKSRVELARLLAR